jgi:hypothetical protein
MSRRVYEIASELNLSTKEVIDRLNGAGIEVKHHYASVEDPVYQRVFGNSSGTAAPNGRPEAQKSEALRSRIQSPRKRSPARRVLVYILAAALAFAVAAGVGTIAALTLGDNLGFSERGGEREEPRRPAEEQGNAPQRQGAVADRSQQKDTEKEVGGEPKEAAPQQSQAEYVARVGDIQERSVETFLDSHDKLMSYDALTSDDVEEMQANQATLQGFTDQVNDLDPPQKYKEQYEVFRAAIKELHEASQLAYTLAANPIDATKSEFDEQDRHVDQAAAGLQRSNEILGRDYKTIEGVRMEEISPI